MKNKSKIFAQQFTLCFHFLRSSNVKKLLVHTFIRKGLESWLLYSCGSTTTVCRKRLEVFWYFSFSILPIRFWMDSLVRLYSCSLGNAERMLLVFITDQCLNTLLCKLTCWDFISGLLHLLDLDRRWSCIGRGSLEKLERFSQWYRFIF